MKTILPLILSFCIFSVICAQPVLKPVQVLPSLQAKHPDQGHLQSGIEAGSSNPGKNTQASKMKTNAGAMFLMDSAYFFDWNPGNVSWNTTQRQTYTFDPSGNEIQNKIDLYNQNSNVFIPYGSISRSFYTDGNLEEVISYDWNPAAANYRPLNKLHYEYNEWNYVIEEIGFTWKSGINDWVPDSKGINEYNGIGQITESISSYWDPATGSWLLIAKDTYIYDSINRLIEGTIFMMDQELNTWIPEYKYTYEYDSASNIVEHTAYEWYDAINSLINSYKDTMVYDAAGNKIESIRKNWNYDDEEWQLNYKETSSYNQSGRKTEYISYSWDLTFNEWNEHEMQEYSYDAENRITQLIISYWNGQLQVWNMRYKSEYTYTSDGKLKQVSEFYWGNTASDWTETNQEKFEFDEFGNQVAMITSGWDAITSSLIYYTKLEYYYSVHQTNDIEDDPAADDILVYPVPAFNSLCIGNAKPGTLVSIFDCSGNLMLKHELQKTQETIHIGMLAKGMYYIKLVQEGSETRKKFIKL